MDNTLAFLTTQFRVFGDLCRSRGQGADGLFVDLTGRRLDGQDVTQVMLVDQTGVLQ